MLPGTNFGDAKVIATAGATVVTSGNAYIIGVLFHGTATNTARIWAGVTATVTATTKLLSGIIRANATAAVTANAPTYIPFPAYASGGITIEVGGAGDPSLTLFWNPAGGA